MITNVNKAQTSYSTIKQPLHSIYKGGELEYVNLNEVEGGTEGSELVREVQIAQAAHV